jgi:hypothetical protein
MDDASRREAHDTLAADPAVRATRAIAIAIGLVVLGLSTFVIVERFRYPIDAEWMVGAVREGVERLRVGKPLYVEPSGGFIPFIYGPLYFGASALVAHVSSVFVACKIVSLASTVLLGWGIVVLARMFAVPRFWTAAAVLLHAATYPITLYFFDLERVDTFAVAVVMLGVVTVLRNESYASAAVGGALLGLAFFAKQMNVVVLAAAAAGMLVAGQRRRAAITLGAGAAVLALGFGYLEAKTGPWFRFYCLKLPGAHGVEPKLLSTFFIVDVPKVFALAIGSVAVIASVAATVVRSFRRRGGDAGSDAGARPEARAGWREIVFASVLASSLAGAYFMRVHRGGWINVILLWTPFACAATAIAAARLEESARGTRAERSVMLVLAGAVAVQLLGAVFDPNDNAPDADDYAEDQRLRALVKTLERQGEVVVTTRGDMTSPPHAHAAALYDIIRAGLPAPPSFVHDLETRRYAALLVNDPGEYSCDVSPTCKDLVRVVEENYFVAARREERLHTGMTGFDARPRWIMRPRKHPLSGLTDDQLFRRAQTEMGLAESRRRQAPFKTELLPDDTIEDLAATALARRDE